MKRRTTGILCTALMMTISSNFAFGSENFSGGKYSENDLYVLEHVIAGECNDCGWDMKISVGSVVINRVADDRFPDSIEEVVFQPGQYACTWDGNYYKEPNAETVEATKYLLENGTQIDESVVWQAEFVQGNGVYDVIGNMYFCY